MSNNKLYTLLCDSTAEITEKKSRFIAIAMRVESEAEALKAVECYRKQNRDARHVCFAYSIDGRRTVRASDDGEPSGTAGVPILDLIKKRDLDNVLVLVIRYFGGILLGAPGLVRAYSGAAKAALDKALLAEYCVATSLRCGCSYSEFEKLKVLLEKNEAYDVNVDFAESVTVDFKCESDHVQHLCGKITECFAGKISAEVVSEIAELRKKK